MTGADMETRLRMLTPEGVGFSFRLAGPGIRMCATLLDYLALYAALFGVSLLLNIIPHRAWGISSFVWALVALIVPIAYDALLEWRMRGQTLGKRLFRLRVMDAHGLPLRFPQVLTRNLMRLIDGLPVFYLTGALACILSRHYRRLGDQIASTVVVHEGGARTADLQQLLTQKYVSFLSYPDLAARLRQSARPEEAELALEALLRRDRLTPEARAVIYGEVAEFFQTRVPFPEELRESLSDEQYVRNVVAVLYPRRLLA